MLNETARVVRFHQLGGPDVLRLDNLPLPEPGPGEVRMRVHAFGVNRSDILYRQGQYIFRPQLPATLGYEASGVVEAVGPNVDPALIGRAFSNVPNFTFLQYGVYGEVAILPASSLVVFPDRLSFVQAAATWVSYMTSYGQLVGLANIAPGDFVVITAASSSVGLAALDIVRAEGAISIAITRTAAKKEALLSLGAHHVIVSSEEDVAARILDISQGVGARVVFDAVGGEGTRVLAQGMSPRGIMFIYGVLSMQATIFPVFSAIPKGLTMRGFTLYGLLGMPAVREAAERYIFSHLADGTFEPRVARVFTLDQVADAHRYVESNQQIGKIVVTVNEVDTPLPGIY